ncbi:thiol-disulfide oxidoreductase DCC family protein [Flammeovirgaceae bacterium SG7u.111]|nr:thiol-disulfide oxidoreductase DCC family protein [Flammeovirgaceae bacterium SG7u.132]WPO35121.1 thiol-disulfide oxidoreductase DCC family protein [Flammeovirgaceae bacterium SG7u.111]
MNYQQQRVILFDGVCNLCNSSVNFIIDRDEDGYFTFASLQSEGGQQLLKDHDLDTFDFDSFVYYDKGKIYKKSTAAIKVASKLGGLWSLMSIFIIIPASLRNAIYSLIAKNRYKWFGKKNECRMPTPELQSRFL